VPRLRMSGAICCQVTNGDTFTLLVCYFRGFRKIAKKTISFVNSVGLSACKNSASSGQIFKTFDILVFLKM
jgi:hypothetical protein